MHQKLEDFKKVVLFGASIGPEDPSYEDVKKTIQKKYDELLYESSVSSKKIEPDLAKEELQKNWNTCVDIDYIHTNDFGVGVFFEGWEFWKNDKTKMNQLINQFSHTQWKLHTYQRYWIFILTCEWEILGIKVNLGFRPEVKKEREVLDCLRLNLPLNIAPNPMMGSCLVMSGIENSILSKLDLWDIIKQRAKVVFN